MLIIGEKINGTRSSVARAIAARDSKAIQALAMKQVEAGSHYLDINAGTPPDQEPEDLLWLVKTVQTVVDIPLSLDSANPHALAVALQAIQKPALVNSISGEETRLREILPLVKRYDCSVIALVLDRTGVPKSSAMRLAVATEIMQATRGLGVPDEKVFFDPLTLTLASDSTSGKTVLETMSAIRSQFPEAKSCLGLSNISFGLPYRSYINRAFITLALQAGLDAAILDPLDHELRIALLAAEAVLGQDKAVVKFIRSLRVDPASSTTDRANP